MAATNKSASAFRTIGELAEDLGLPQHILRYWETVNGHNSLQSATNAHCRQLTEFTATAFIQRSSNSH